MPIVESEFALSRDPRLAAQLADHATSVTPAWLWSTDGARILWANAVGAAIFGAANPGALATRQFDAGSAAAAEIIRLVASLPSAGQARLERLRGFGASFGRALTCMCSRFALTDGSAAVFVAATEPAGPPLTLHERVSRLFADRTGTLAVFAPDGTNLYANEAARTRLGGAPSLSALGIGGVATQAVAAGSAAGATGAGPITVQRLGTDASRVLVVSFGAQSSEAGAPETVSAKVEPAAPQPAAPADVAATTLAPSAASAWAPDASQPAPATNGAARGETTAERRHPLRFVWQMDADGRFVLGSDEFAELIGPRTTAAFGRSWSEVAAELKLDPDHQVARAMATRETWSGINVSWPVDDGGERLPVELSGLPVFDRERNFRGYRGFGVCRDIGRINQLARARRERPIGFMTRPEAPPERDDAAELVPEQIPAVEANAATAAPAETAVAPPSPPEPQVAAPSAPAIEPSEEVTQRTDRVLPSAAPAAANVVPFRSGTPAESKAPSLSPVERKAFRELAQELTARLGGGRESALEASAAEELAFPAEPAQPVAEPSGAEPAPSAPSEKVSAQHEQNGAAPAPALPPFAPALLDRFPLGVLIYQNDMLLYANRYFLEFTGYRDLDALTASGGLNALFAEPAGGPLAQSGAQQSMSVMTKGGERRPVDGRLVTVPWAGASAIALILISGEAEERRRAAAQSLSTAEQQIRELTAKLESFKQSEEELRAATREAQKATAAKSDFLSKVSHEIRTPLNAITGFTEVIMSERFGPIGNDRYRDYLKDVHEAGMHLVSLLNDLLDLSKIESGQLNLTFANVSLNDLTKQCVGIMQPQASRSRIIIRTALAPALPQVVADERSLRQIVLNLLSNSIKFTGPGGQVIVSTAFADSGEAVLRVRDTGVGMTEKDVEAALEPFRQTQTSGSWGSGGTGLGLPLTKALAEANRAHFSIKSAPNAGTLIEVAFPPARVVAAQ